MPGGGMFRIILNVVVQRKTFIQGIQCRSFDSLGQSRVVVVPALTWKTSVRAVSIRVEIRSLGRRESANHYTSMEAWLGRSLHKRTLRNHSSLLGISATARRDRRLVRRFMMHRLFHCRGIANMTCCAHDWHS